MKKVIVQQKNEKAKKDYIEVWYNKSRAKIDEY